MHNTNSKDKLEESIVRMRVQTPCSAATQSDLHSFYKQRSLPSEATRRISRHSHFGHHCIPFEPHRIHAWSNASVLSASEGLAGSSCSRGQGEDVMEDHRTHESRASVNLCSK